MPNSEKNADPKGLDVFLNQIDVASLNAQQKQAFSLLKEKGLPTRKVEAWKYSDLRWFNQHHFNATQHYNTEQVNQWLNKNILNSKELSELPRIVTVNGQICNEFSTLLTHPDFCVEMDNSFYGELANPHDIMTALNYVAGRQAFQVKIQKEQQAGTALFINFGYASSDEHLSFHPRFYLNLENNSQFSIVEFNIGEGTYFTNPVMEVNIGSHADFQYNKLINSSSNSFICSNTYIELSDHAKYSQFVMTKGGAFSRQQVNVALKGERSIANFHAVQTLNNKQHADITTIFSHLVPHCESEQNVKNILSDQSHGVFQGKVLVDQKAQKTNAQQQNQALLLSDQAEINTKPELEIYADDVKCSHGATVGALDEEQLFFLMSRGIPYELARQMLINAFIATAVEVVEDPIAKALLKEQLGVKVVEDIV